MTRSPHALALVVVLLGFAGCSGPTDTPPDCVDKDGDGFGVDCQAGADCNDNDVNVYRKVALYVDADGDGYTVGASSITCIGDNVPAGLRETSDGVDCNDDAITIHEPLTSCDAVFECGVVDDGCGGTVSCGACGANAVCGSDHTCACAADFVELNGACVANACTSNPCGPRETCSTTVAGASCQCAPGFIRAATGDCLIDLGTGVADISTRPITLTVGGIGTFQAHQLSAVGMEWSIQRVGIGAGSWPVYDTLSSPPVKLGAITGEAAQLSALTAAVQAGTPLNVQLELSGVAGQVARVSRSSVEISVVSGEVVSVNGAAAVGALQVNAPLWEVTDRVDIPLLLRPQPSPGVSVEIPGTGAGPWRFSPAALNVGVSDVAAVLPGVADIIEPYTWFTDAVSAWLVAGSMDYRQGALVDFNVLGAETGRRTLSGAVPRALWFFDPSRTYGAGPLVTVEVAFAAADPGPCPAGRQLLSSGVCGADLGPTVVDVSHRPVTMTVAGVGSFQVHQLSSIGMKRPVTRVQVVNQFRPVYEPLELPPVTAGTIAGDAATINALLTALQDPGGRDVTFHLEGLAGQWLDARSPAAIIQLVDSTPVDINGAPGIAALRIIPVAMWQVPSQFEIPEPFRPKPLPGVLIEIEGITQFWYFAPGVVDSVPGDFERVLPGISISQEGFSWFVSTSTEFDNTNVHHYRPMSFVQKNASDFEVSRNNAFYVLPSEVWLFDATRSYGNTPLVTLLIVFGIVVIA